MSKDIQFPWFEIFKDFAFAVIVTGLLLFFYKQFYEYIEKSEKVHGILFKKNPYPLWIYDLKTLRFLNVNEAAITLYGYSEEEFLNMTIADIRLEDDVPALISAVENIKLNFNHSYHWSGTWRHKRKDGQLIYAEISSHEIIYKGKKSEFVLAYNVTEKVEQDLQLQALNRELEEKVMSRTNDFLHLNRKLIDQNKIIKSANLELYNISTQLQEANERSKEHADLRGKFVSIVSHEFKTPLMVIQGAAEFVKRYFHQSSPEAILTRMESIEKQTGHMTALLDDLLTIGKTETAKLEVQKEQVDICKFITKLVAEVESANRGTHRILLQINETVPDNLKTDEKLLRNIFINLLNNAIKYSPESDVVYFDVMGSDNEISFAIKDNGMGIDANEINKIFEPFYRIDATRKIEGTGLGLFIVKRAADLIHARVSVKSENGNGSLFTVAIPIVPD
jgi:PAS domain S-box-containing protein